MISVILPTYNEKDNIVKLINSILNNVKNCEVIVVDDNSPDLTWKEVQKIKKKNVRVIRRIKEKGLASAIARGVEESKGDVIIWMDCDFSHPPFLIPKLVEKLDKYDISIASRYVKDGADKRKFIRVFTSRIFNLYTQIILMLNVKDTDSGFIAVKRKVFDKIKLSTEGYGEYFIQFIYECQQNGFKITEIPYVNEDRILGESKTGESLIELLKQGFNYCVRVLKIRFEK